MLRGCWRVLKSGGMLWVRLASTIGLTGATPLGGRRFRLADGTDRYLVDAALLKRHTAALGGELLDTIKTTLVDDLRSMTTWVVRKDPVGPSPMNQAQLIDFATRYAAAWSSGDPDRLAAFYAADGALIVNGGTPATGRAAVAATARGFMTAFPDMVVRLDYLNQDGWKARFHWLWTGTNTGPGGTGKAVRMRGYEDWTLAPDGKIQLSDGHYDDAEYQRQLKFGAPPES
jgi:ketosteroid isomerase-like protein